MNHIWALVVILVAFGVVGRIDYDAAGGTEDGRATRGERAQLAEAGAPSQQKSGTSGSKGERYS